MTKTSTLFIILSLLLFFSCKDNDIAKIPPSISKQSSQDYLLAEKMFCEVGRIIEEGMNVNDVFKGVTYYMQNSNPLNSDTLNIDFGTSTTLNGNNYKGEIEIIFTGNYSDSGTVIISKFPQNNPFHINNYQILGTRTVTNLGENTEGYVEFLIEITDGEIKAPTPGGGINLNIVRTRKWVHGINTTELIDDKYLIHGEGSGIDMTNNIFDITISQPILLDYECILNGVECFLINGEVDVFPEGLSQQVINYGDSTCDCNFIVTIEGNNYPIYLD